MPSITLSNGKSFSCEPSQTIIEAADAAGIVLEHSCKSGRCNSCEALVLEGETKRLSEELVALAESDPPMILTCCRTALTDLKLSIKDLGIAPRPNPIVAPSKIQSLEFLAADILKVTLRFPPSLDFKFVAGQYINLRGPDGTERSYSVANESQTNTLTLHIRRYSNGKMSHYLFDRACVGDLLQVSGPFGTFGLRDDTASNIIFIATGTGIAPILSMLGLHQNALDSKSVSVYWGGRRSNDIYAAIEKIPCVDSFRPVLSREHKDSYLAGYVQDAVLNDVANFSSTSVYACGSPQMIKDCGDALVSKGLDRSRFYSDAFVESSKESEL